MIHALATQYPAILSIEIIYPDNRPHKFTTITGGTAEQRVCRATGRLQIECRDYILEKLTAWLRQRQFGHKNINGLTTRQVAAQLTVLISFYNQRGFYDLCQFVAKHDYVFEAIAPSNEASGHYKYFENTIRKIVRYCSDVVQQDAKK